MKKLVLMITFLVSSLCFAGEVTGVGQEVLRVLAKHHVDVNELRGQGLKVLAGEVTGVGKSINLDRIEMLVTKKKLFKMNSLSHVEYIHPSAAKALKDVKHMEFDQNILSPNQVKAIIYQ